MTYRHRLPEWQGSESPQEQTPWQTHEWGDQAQRGQWLDQREIRSEDLSRSFSELTWGSENEPSIVRNMEKSKEKECSWKYLLFFSSWAKKVHKQPAFPDFPASNSPHSDVQSPASLRSWHSTSSNTVQGLQDTSSSLHLLSGETCPTSWSLILCLDHHETS